MSACGNQIEPSFQRKSPVNVFAQVSTARSSAAPSGSARTTPSKAWRAVLAVGRSTHDDAQAESAVKEAADYVAFGPLFGTASKDTGYDARGLEGLARVAEIAGPRPVVAIGGIDARGAVLARDAGASAVAVISEVANAADPVAATRRLAAVFEER